MEAMVSAYVFAWAVVTVYLTWLAVQNGQVRRRLDALERQEKASIGERRFSSKAA